jgi:iron complex outermembrane receptor protein
MSLSGRFWGTDDFIGYGNTPTSSGIPAGNFPASGAIPAIALPQDQVDIYLAGGTPAWGNATFIPNVYDPDNRRSSHFLTTAALFRHAATSNFNWEASYQHVDTARIYENGPVGVGYQPGANNYGKYAGNIDTAAVRATTQVTPWLTVTAGYEFEHEYYYDHQDDNMPVPARVSTQTHAWQDSNTGYVAAQLALLNRRLQISLSGRAQSFRLSDPEFDYSGTDNPYTGVKSDVPSAFTGDASIAYFIPATNTKIRAHGGNSYRAPGLYERFGAGFYGDWLDPTKVIFTPYGDPRLAPDRYNSVDGGIDQYFFSDHLRFSGTYFYTRLSQLTAWSYNLPLPDPFGRPYGYINGAGGISRGIETSVEARPLSSLTLNASYTYVNANSDRDSTVAGYYRTFYTPKHMVGLVVMKDWKRRLNTTFDLYHYSESLNSFVYYGGALSFTGYTKAGLVVGYDVWRGEKRSARIYTKMDNLFNRTFYVSGYRAAGITGIGGVSFLF